MLINAFIIALFTLSILGTIMVIVFGGIEKITEKFPKFQNFLINMFNSEED